MRPCGCPKEIRIRLINCNKLKNSLGELLAAVDSVCHLVQTLVTKFVEMGQPDDQGSHIQTSRYQSLCCMQDLLELGLSFCNLDSTSLMSVNSIPV